MLTQGSEFSNETFRKEPSSSSASAAVVSNTRRERAGCSGYDNAGSDESGETTNQARDKGQRTFTEAIDNCL